MKTWIHPQRHFKTLLLIITGLFAFGVCVKLSWIDRQISFEANQAAFDAYYYHVPQINEFISHGFSANYHNFVAMTPGLHLLYAGMAQLIGLSDLDYRSGTLFAIHSIWMLLYLGLNLTIILNVLKRNEHALIITLPLLASSYPAFSWIWPTTDLPATVLYLIAINLEFYTWKSNTPRLIMYALLGAAGVFIRQHYAFLAGIPAGMLVIEALLRRDWRLDLRHLAISITPIVPSLVILAYFVSIWGGPVPPDQAFHFAPLSAPVSLVHVLGFTGLIGAPFAWSLVRLVRRDDICLSCMLLLSAVVAGAAITLLPLEPNVLEGRFGSMLWTIETRLPSQALHLGYLFAAIWLGTAIWIAVAAICWKQRYATPAVMIFALYVVTLLVQEYCFQRYIEEPILLTLAVFILLQSRLPRFEHGLWAVCFGLYGVISWGKMLVNVGGLGLQ